MLREPKVAIVDAVDEGNDVRIDARCTLPPGCTWVFGLRCQYAVLHFRGRRRMTVYKTQPAPNPGIWGLLQLVKLSDDGMWHVYKT